MACEGNYNKIPINIDKSEIIKLSKNLSRFTYDFKGVSKINIVEEKVVQLFPSFENYMILVQGASILTLGFI